MATSDVLQFRYCIENEVARKATKNFAEMLEKAFDQYKKLWIEYLKLRKYCENADVKIPFQFFEPTSDNNDIVILPQAAKNCMNPSNEHINQLSSNHCKQSSSGYGSITASTLDKLQTVNETTLLNDNSIDQKQIVENKLSYSPVLVKERKTKKNCVTPDFSILDDSDEVNAFLPVRENITILENSFDEHLSETFVENNENDCSNILNNNDQIECTPLSKLPKKLGVSKLYNVETTLLQSGKKLKQSKLVFLSTSSSKENIDQENYKKCTSLELSNDSGLNQNVDEEIIEDSPTKRKILRSKMKSWKLKKKSPMRLRDSNCQKDNSVSKYNDNKIASLSQHLPVCTSTQKDKLYAMKKFETFSILNNESIGSNRNVSHSPVSPILADIESAIEFENLHTVSASQTHKRKLLKVMDETCNYNSSSNDETFCLLGEKLKEKSTTKVGSVENNTDELCENVSSNSPPEKKYIMDSYDVVPKKEHVFTDKTKNRTERAKMAGTTCWECEKYYGNLGLSENQIKARQKECSRHRTKYSEKPSTPEGFWDPLFPDTYSSTFQDD